MRNLVRILILASCAFATAEELGDIRIELLDEFASFTNRSHPDNRIGYRFHEHTPLTYGDVPLKSTHANLLELPPTVEPFKTLPAGGPSTGAWPTPAGFLRTGLSTCRPSRMH